MMFALLINFWFIDTVNISDEIKNTTGWWFRRQYINDLISFYSKNGPVDLLGVDGMYLRTLSAKDYFKIVDRLKEKLC